MQESILKVSQLDTRLGPLVAIANERALYFLVFADGCKVEQEIEGLKSKTKSEIVPGKSSPICSIEKELGQYFDGNLKEFKTPLFFFGSSFQRSVWEELMKIPYGKTISYSELSTAIGKPTACRAVAQANGANAFAVVIPCHRVIQINGELGGYAAGVARKKWLIDHEKQR